MAIISQCSVKISMLEYVIREVKILLTANQKHDHVTTFTSSSGVDRGLSRRRASLRNDFRTFATNFDFDFFLKILPVERWWVSDVRNVKIMGVTDFVLERTCPEEHLNLSKSGFVSEEGHSGCKSQNIAIRALKGCVLCQIWFKCTH